MPWVINSRDPCFNNMLKKELEADISLPHEQTKNSNKSET